MSLGPYRSIFRSLQDRDLLIPYLRNAILANDWPMQYNIPVDSSPYYGLGDGYFHPSTHCVTTNFNLAGARFLYYLFHKDHTMELLWEPRDVQDEMTLAMGSALHAVAQTQFQQAGILRPEMVEVEYVIPEHWVRGKIDMIVDHPNEGEVVVEFKTQNSRSFDFQTKIKPEWEAQLSMGLYARQKTEGVLLVLEAGFPYHMREYRVKRNDAMLAEIFEKFDHVRESIAADQVPLHCCAKGSVDNKRCPARLLCWDKGKVARET